MAKVWDAEEVKATVGGVEIDDLLSFSYNSGIENTHIETVAGVVGYNRKWQKPTWSLKCRASSNALDTLIGYLHDRSVIDVTFTAPGLEVQVKEAIINKVDFGEVGEEATEVTVEGLALQIDETKESTPTVSPSGEGG